MKDLISIGALILGVSVIAVLMKDNERDFPAVIETEDRIYYRNTPEGLDALMEHLAKKVD